MAEPKEKYPDAHPFFPDHALKEVILILLVIGAIISLAVFFPAPMEEKADPFKTPPHIKPEWYFLAAYQTLKVAEVLGFMGAWAPKLIGVMSQGILFAIIFFWPWIDKNRFSVRQMFIFGGALTLLFAVFTVWGHYS